MIELPELLVPDAAAWRSWLLENADDQPGVRLVLHKKGGSVTTLTYEEALQEALCFGWIDGQVNRRDEGSFYQRFTPRTVRSPWSARNVDRIAQLSADGRMQPGGLAAVTSAQADGRWDRASPGPATAVLADDFATAIAANPKAQAMYDVLTSQNRYALIYRVEGVKRADTRARRIAEFVAMLAREETVHPQRKRPGAS